MRTKCRDVVLRKGQLRNRRLGGAQLHETGPDLRRQVNSVLGVLDCVPPFLRDRAGEQPLFAGVVVAPRAEQLRHFQSGVLGHFPPFTAVHPCRVTGQVNAVVAGFLDRAEHFLRLFQDVVTDPCQRIRHDGVFECHNLLPFCFWCFGM